MEYIFLKLKDKKVDRNPFFFFSPIPPDFSASCPIEFPDAAQDQTK